MNYTTKQKHIKVAGNSTIQVSMYASRTRAALAGTCFWCCLDSVLYGKKHSIATTRSSRCCSGDAESLSFQGWQAELARGSNSRRLLPLTMDYVSEIVSVREACVRCWDIPDLWPWPWVIAGTRLQGALSENRKMHKGRFLVWMNAGMTVAVQEIWKPCFLHPWDQTWVLDNLATHLKKY